MMLGVLTVLFSRFSASAQWVLEFERRDSEFPDREPLEPSPAEPQNP